MCQKIDRLFFNRLSALDPGVVCRRTLAQYDRKKKCYRIEAFGCLYEVNPASGDILPVGDIKKPVSVELGLLILFYLLHAKDIPLAGRWVNEFSLKGGALFFRGPHEIRNEEIADRFGNDTEGFKAVCSRLGAQPLEMGDAAFHFQVLPRVPVAVVLWYGDNEFEASAKLLMDATIDSHLPLDVIYALAVELVEMLLENR